MGNILAYIAFAIGILGICLFVFNLWHQRQKDKKYDKWLNSYLKKRGYLVSLTFLLFTVLILSGCAVTGQPGFDLASSEVGDCPEGTQAIIIHSPAHLKLIQARTCRNGIKSGDQALIKGFCNKAPMESFYIKDDKLADIQNFAYVAANSHARYNIRLHIKYYCGWNKSPMVLASDSVSESDLIYDPGVLWMNFHSYDAMWDLQERECAGGDQRFCGELVKGYYDPQPRSMHILAGHSKSTEIAYHEADHAGGKEDNTIFKFHCFEDRHGGNSGVNPMNSGHSSCMK